MWVGFPERFESRLEELTFQVQSDHNG